MAEKKSIIEEALLDAKLIKDALTTNSKEMLRSLAKSEIEKMVKESLDEVKDEEKVNVLEDDVIEQEVDDEEEVIGDEPETDDTDLDTDAIGEPDDEVVAFDDEEGDDEFATDLGADDSEFSDFADDDMADYDDEEELDLTGASDDEVVKVFKQMKGNDELEVVGDVVKIKADDTEYRIELGGNNNMAFSDDSEEPLYEIEINEEKPVRRPNPHGPKGVKGGKDEEGKSDEIIYDLVIEDEPVLGEKTNTLANARKSGGKIPREGKYHPNRKMNESTPSFEAKYKNVLTKYTELKEKNDQYKVALTDLRGKLNEVAIFNSNFAYSTKLFMEHSTTKGEKENIIKRFDSVESLKESKNLYKQILGEMSTRGSLKESVEKKVSKPLMTGSKTITESAVYVDPEIARIKDLMSKL